MDGILTHAVTVYSKCVYSVPVAARDECFPIISKNVSIGIPNKFFCSLSSPCCRVPSLQNPLSKLCYQSTPDLILQLYEIQEYFTSIPGAAKFNKEGLKVHNALRNFHGSGELKSSPQLVMGAQKRCKNIIESGTVTQARRRSVESKAGENMVIMCDAMKTEYSAKDAIMKW